MRIVVHCPVSNGGIAEYSHYQANALVEVGADVTLLCPRGFLSGRSGSYRKVEAYPPDLPRLKKGLNGIKRVTHAVRIACRLVANELRMALFVGALRPDATHCGSYMEYLSPLWIWPQIALARWGGIIFSANLHDPVRDLIVGPKWWHVFSQRLAYVPLSLGVVHSKLEKPLLFAGALRLVETPHGFYKTAGKQGDGHALRSNWGVPDEAYLFLSLGFIRDNKNIDLLIGALVANPRAYLVVMGVEQSSKDKQIEYYRKLAVRIGVEDRVFFRNEFVPDEELPGVFAAADAIALTYGQSFCSQSGVLNLAASARKPVLAASGESALKDSVQRFNLGLFVEPDSLPAVEEGMSRLIEQGSLGVNVDPIPPADWEGYAQFASWHTNASLLLEALSQVRSSREQISPNKTGKRAEHEASPRPRLIYFCDQSVGGIAKNSYEQAKALVAAGTQVTFLCPSDWVLGDLPSRSKVIARLSPGPKYGNRLKIWSQILSSVKIIKNIYALDVEISRSGVRCVMFGSYFEYLSPFWAFVMRRQSRNGVTFGVMVLDPVRDYQVGPLWWHLASVAGAYSFFREIFVHKEIALDTVRPVPGQRVTVVPHGPYLYQPGVKDCQVMRADLGIAQDATVFLSFGHLRDNKNLDLLLQAMIHMPKDVVLLVAGSEASPGQRRSAEYQTMAQVLNVNQRIRWVVRYIPEDEVQSLFAAADFATLTYSSSFHSTSGILHLAAPMRIPLLVSCGDAPLGSMTEDYRLGVRIEPDSVDAIVTGMNRLLSGSYHGDWDRFLKDFSYAENARIVQERLFEVRDFEPC
jgi:glycosyltransferase involved in cell wall biosynthesis